ncbi:hypothetical protein [Anabaena sp. CA = ATCC 33047]|uniref:hypothetical protein n=1 Tax=Anabaena sp. (strain CA / ATCC 33047) TaxID=52271 RepID=UPI0008369DC1|nr:hypothetical protein [Anabaena sp. CA = ATCC 33047]
MWKLTGLAVAVAMSFLTANQGKVYAVALPNGSFESGNFNNWTTIGQTTVESASFGIAPANGTYQAVLETLQDVTGISASNLETFLELSSGSLTDLGVVEGSAIKRAITVNAGDRLTFDWNFLTDQVPADPDYNDFAFVSLGNINQLANTNSVNSLSFSRLAQQTGYKSYTHKFTTAGTYTLGFGVVDMGDDTVNSALVLDNLQITPVPEPTTIFSSLMVVGLGSAFKIKFAHKRKPKTK